MIQTIGVAAIYLLIHLAAYVLVFRNVRAFTNEGAIFLYHLVSVVVVSTVALVTALIPGSGTDWTTAAAIVALHGIYSISFLELWSLAEGSYSLQIMSHLQRLKREGGAVNVAVLRDIGTAKQANRTDGLIKLGLLGHHEGQLRLTGVGRIVAGLLAAIAWLANVRDEG